MVGRWGFGLALLACAAGAFSRGDQVQKHDKLLLKVVELTNKERKKRGFGELKVNDCLMKSAAWMAEDISKRSELSHRDSKGRMARDRIPTFGYVDWTNLGENLAAGPTSPEELIEMWIDSPSHYKVMMSADAKEIGIGYTFAPKSEFVKYWVMNVGARREPKPEVPLKDDSR